MNTPSSTPPEPVEPGQVWADNDKRSSGRHLRVLSVHDDGYALLKRVTPKPGGGFDPTVTAPTRIRIDRLRPTSTGYRLVQHADGTPAAPGGAR